MLISSTFMPVWCSYVKIHQPICQGFHCNLESFLRQERFTTDFKTRVCVFMCVTQAHVCGCTLPCAEARGGCWVFCSYSLETGQLADPELDWRSANPRNGVTGTQVAMPYSSCRCWGLELRFLCLQSKCFYPLSHILGPTAVFQDCWWDIVTKTAEFSSVSKTTLSGIISVVCSFWSLFLKVYYCVSIIHNNGFHYISTHVYDYFDRIHPH